jgi:roadblock/LC7 domain-containing protein
MASMMASNFHVGVLTGQNLNFFVWYTDDPVDSQPPIMVIRPFWPLPDKSEYIFSNDGLLMELDSDDSWGVVVMVMTMTTMTIIMITMTRPNYSSFASLDWANKVTVEDSSPEVARILFISSERVVILASRET